MPTRTAEAEWNGSLTEGQGSLKVQSGAFSGPYDWQSRSAQGPNTNPEELLGAAHAGCFNMALSNMLTEAGFEPTRLHTTAKVTIDKVGDGFAITGIALQTQAEVPGIDEAAFRQHAEAAKKGCPVSKALAATEITLNASLK